ncbi:MAG TPA: glycosyltransferase family 2 protein [Caulobacteraceae bacterium]|nr:glycosyltransferase family 2 protein [Caulobacteraceae bacterium]
MLSLLDRRTLAPPGHLKLEPTPPVVAERPAQSVSIAIPTQRRPEGLAVAARSTFRQTGVDPGRLELVIVDNDQVPSAEPVARQLASEAPFPVRYVHEPAAGVANARNAALATAHGDLIAFIDDDEEASSGWLAALIETQARYDADVVFGPVRARAPAPVRRHRQYLEQFFSREGPADTGIIAHYYGCGDSLVRRAALPHPTQPFSALRNEVGGEDDHLFGLMSRQGARFAWAHEALVYEDPVAGRLTLRYALARAFAYGQGPTYGCATADPPDWAGAVRWIAIGLAQTGAFGLFAAAQWLTRSPHRAFAFDRLARGAGKVLFGGPFKQRFYGRTS